jgi:Glycosyltransferase family 87
MNRSSEAEGPPALSAPREPHWLRRRIVLIGVWSAAGLWMLIMAEALPARANKWDYSIYYSSALAMRQGINPYTADLTSLAHHFGFDLGKINHATDPPTFVLCFEPLTWFSPRTGFWVWTGINAFCFLAALVLLLRWTPGLEGETAWIVAALALLFPPVVDHLVWGQNKMLVLLMLVLMMHWMEQRKDAAAGLILAFATLLRAFPLLLVAYLMLMKRWRVVWYTIVGLAIGGLATLALVGVVRSLSFLLAMGYLTQGWREALPGNIAVGPSVSRMFWYFFGTHLDATMEWTRRAAAAAAQLLVLGFTVKATVKRVTDGDPDWRLLALWIMTAILFSPTSWFYYLVLLTIPMVEMSAAALDGRVSRRALWTGIAGYILAWLYYVGVAVNSHHWAAHPQGLVWRLGAAPIGLLAYLSLYWFAVDQGPRTRAGRGAEIEHVSSLCVAGR